MATSAWVPETFSCPICLETLKDPATIPCGHSYCLLCIQKHWDQTAAKGSYECPQCRQQFNPRPVLARSNVLMEAIEKLRLSGNDGSNSSLLQSVILTPYLGRVSGVPSSQNKLYPPLPTSSLQLCPLHQQVLELYCYDDKESICVECSLLAHKGHQVVCVDEDKKKIQEDLIMMNSQVQRSIADRERLIQSLSQVSHTQNSSVKKLIVDSQTFFTDILRRIELSRSEVLQLLQAHEQSSSSHIEARSCRLQQEIVQLHKKHEELQKLEAIQDPVSFLNSFMALDSMAWTENGTVQTLTPEKVTSGVRSALNVYREGLDNLTKTCLACIFRVVNDAAAVAHTADEDVITRNPMLSSQHTDVEKKSDSTKPDIKPKVKPSSLETHEHHKNQNCASANPETFSVSTVEKSADCCLSNSAPKTREEMLKFRIEPTFDYNSVYRHIRFSETNRKATLCTENQNYPEHPDRFMYWRQVMCVEPLAGSPYYWEVEWTGQRVTIGVAYKDMERSAADDSARLGHNPQSWSLYWSGKAFSMWHAGKETVLAGPKTRRIGVYLDQQAGVLAFYRVSHNQAQEICCVHTNFDRPLFPSFRFWSGVGSSITICELS